MTAHEAIILAAGIICGGIALVGLFRPFLGILVLLTIHLVQPGELFPALAPFRIELVYGLAVTISVIVLRALKPDRAPLFSNRILLGAIFLVGAAALTIPFAVWRGGAFQSTVELVKLVTFLFLLSSLIDTHARLRQVIWFLVGVLVWFAVSGFAAYTQGNVSHLKFESGETFDRAQGITTVAGGPNELASLLLTLLPFLVVAFRCCRSILLRLWLLACGGIAIAAMVLTGARAVMLSLIGVTLYYILRSKHNLAAMVLFIILACVTWTAMPEQYRHRYLTIQEYAEGGELDASNELRLHIWRVGWQMFLAHPVLGVGAGQFSTAYATIYATRVHQAWMNPHNLLIQVACEMGVIGLIVFGYFLIQIFKHIRAVPRIRGEPDLELNYQVAVACGAMLLGVLAVSFVGHTLYRPYWYLLGSVVAANHSLANRLVSNHVETVSPREETEGQEVKSGYARAAFSAGPER